MSLRACEVFAPRRRRGRPERAVQKAVLIWLRSRGAVVAVTDAGAAYRAGAFFGEAIPPGWPDITGLLPSGQFIGVECKAPGGRQSNIQKLIEREIRKCNGIYILARCPDDVRQRLESFGVELP